MVVVGGHARRVIAAHGRRRVGPAVGVRAQRVRVAGEAVGIHGPQVDAVIDGVHAVIEAGGSQAAGDYNRRGVLGLDGVVGQAQHLHILCGADRVAAAVPFAAQVLLVPDLVGVHAAAIALRQRADEVGIGLEVSRRAVFLAGIAGPGGRLNDAEEDLDVDRFQRVNHFVKRRPVDLALVRLVDFPLDLLLDPGHAQLGHTGSNCGLILVGQVNLDAVREGNIRWWRTAIAARHRRWRRGRAARAGNG